MSKNQLLIRDITKKVTGRYDEYVELSAEVDGDRICFRAPREFDLPVCAEPFVGVALLEAMYRNADIVIDQQAALSEKLALALPEIQSIYKCWNSDLSVIKIIARHAPQTAEGVTAHVPQSQQPSTLDCHPVLADPPGQPRACCRTERRRVSVAPGQSGPGRQLQPEHGTMERRHRQQGTELHQPRTPDR